MGMNLTINLNHFRHNARMGGFGVEVLGGEMLWFGGGLDQGTLRVKPPCIVIHIAGDLLLPPFGKA